MKQFLIYFIFISGFSCMALTPTERTIVLHAKEHLDKVKQKLNEAQNEVAAADERASEAEQHAAQTNLDIAQVKKDIETAHDNEKRLAKENKEMKPVYDQVNSHWGLGAFAYGFKVLTRHLFILLGVSIILILILFGLSFVFPAIIPALRLVGSFLALIINQIRSIFSRR